MEEMHLDEAQDCVRLKFMDSGIFTKGGEELGSAQISDVNVFMFDGNGQMVYRQFFTGNEIVMENLPVYVGEVYTVCVLANWGKEYDVPWTAGIEDFRYNPEDGTDIMNDSVSGILCGVAQGVAFPVDSDVLEIGMQRLYGNVRLKCDFSKVNSTVSLNVEKVRIANVPKGTALFSGNMANEASDVTDGAVLEGEGLERLKTEGADFYMFENLQGYIGDADANKSKALMLTPQQQQVCSYIELECSYLSPERRGTIVYRFYLGTDHTDCNVYRNATQTITVKFKGKVSPDENSVSVDNSALLYRPTAIYATPSLIQFNSYKKSEYSCKVEVQPETAYDKRVVWSSSNPAVASVSQEGVVTTEGKGNCTIKVASVDNPALYATIQIGVYNYTGSN